MRARIEKGVSQEELADAVGVTPKTIHALESGKTTNPNLRLLVNCSLALGVKLDQVIEPMWLQWMVFKEERPTAPDPDKFLNPGSMKVPGWVEELFGPIP